jgi:hypothetical protein
MMTPPPRRTKCGACELRHEERNVEFAGYRRPPVLNGKFRHGPESLHGRVVVDYIESAVGDDGVLDELPHLVRVGEVDRRDARHLAARASYEFDGLFVGLGLDVTPDDLCTFLWRKSAPRRDPYLPRCR